MRHPLTFALLAIAAALLLAAPAAAQVRGGAHIGWHGGHGWHHHHHHGFWGGVGIGIVLWPDAVYERRVPGEVIVQSAPSAPPGPPEPVISPRQGQSPAQSEADRQACDREAMTQPAAMADAAVFHRSALACMERRGYAVSSATR
jgi:hypothetical protein